MWKHFNELRDKKQARNFPKMPNVKGDNISSQKEIAEGFNYFFTALSNLLHLSNEQYCDEQLRADVKSKNQRDETFSVRNITTEEICFYLQSINPSKAAGLDGISPRIIKIASPVIAQSLCHVINLSIMSTTFPSLLKKHG